MYSSFVSLGKFIPRYLILFVAIVFEVSFSQSSRLNSFFLLISVFQRLVQGETCAELFCLFVCFSSDGEG